MSSKIIRAESSDVVAAVFGSCDSNLDIIEKKFSVALHNRVSDDGDEVIAVSGEDCAFYAFVLSNSAARDGEAAAAVG